MSDNYSFIYGKSALKNISLKNKYQITNTRNTKHEFQSMKGSLIGKTTELRKRSLSKKDLRKKIQSESLIESNDGVENKSIRRETSVNSKLESLNDKIDLLSENVNNLRTEINKAENGIRKEIQGLGGIIKSSFEKLENLLKDVLVKRTDNNEEDKKINVNNNANNNVIETPKKTKSIFNYYKTNKTPNNAISFNFIDLKSVDLNYSETIKNNNDQISPNQSENENFKIIENISSSKSKKGKWGQRFFINTNKEITDSSNSSLIDKKEKLNEDCEDVNFYSIKGNNETISSIRKKYQEYKRNNGSK